ncbi:DNA polymerase III subunit delta' [Candidatus Bandiella woodruffii]|uniref:DNA polymerase III subunit delta n=2 Tax=Candidatus Bandiella euplotis TaxID=1664265 RepID=A0ABZ0UIH3_9RICK|nr:DNA polymerase III subunit delta' [Candidatus Bandiella woodruffii]
MDLIKKNLANNTLLHALLIYGESGSGKTFLSNQLASIILNNENAKNHGSHHIDLKSSEDIFILGGIANTSSSIITVEEVRSIKRWLSFTALRAKRKVILINDIDMMNIAASNAFLKILEEPTGETTILLNTSRMSSLPLTLISRCIKLKLRKKTQEEFCAILLSLFPEKSNLQLKTLYFTCDGDLNLAINLIDNNHDSFASHEEIFNHMAQFDLDTNYGLRAFINLLHKFYAETLELKIKNHQPILNSFFINTNKIQRILSNIQHLNKTHAKELIVNILKECAHI